MLLSLQKAEQACKQPDLQGLTTWLRQARQALMLDPTFLTKQQACALMTVWLHCGLHSLNYSTAPETTLAE